MLLDDTATILAHADFFDICSDEQRRMLAFASERRRFAKGETLIVPDSVPEGAFVLVSGRIGSAPADPRVGKAYETATQGAVVGTMALMLAKPRATTVTALEDVEAIFVSRQAFMKLVRQSPDLADRAAVRIRRELGAYLGAIERIGHRFRKE